MCVDHIVHIDMLLLTPNVERPLFNCKLAEACFFYCKSNRNYFQFLNGSRHIPVSYMLITDLARMFRLHK